MIDKKPEQGEVKPEQPLLTLYDLFGFSQAERQQTRAVKRKKTAHIPQKSTSVQPNLFNQNRTQLQSDRKHSETKEPIDDSSSDDMFAGINWMDNPPINGYYEMMMGLQKRKETLQQEANASNQRNVAQSQKEEAMLPRLFSQIPETHHRDGSLVLESNLQVGYLKDVTRYGATFYPLDLSTIQAEKATLYISVRDSYQRLYAYEAEKKEENERHRSALNTGYDEFVQRFGFLNAKANAKLILMKYFLL